MNKLIGYFITIAQIVFVLATIPIAFAAATSFLSGGSHLIGLAWIAIAMGCIGNITNWRKP